MIGKQESKSFARAVVIWIICGVVAVLANVLYLTRDFGRTGGSNTFFLIAGPVLVSLQLALSAQLIRNFRIRSAVWAVVLGGLVGFVMPIVIFILLWGIFTAVFTATSQSWGKHVATDVVWTMLYCTVALVGSGVASGLYFGYARWKICNASD